MFSLNLRSIFKIRIFEVEHFPCKLYGKKLGPRFLSDMEGCPLIEVYCIFISTNHQSLQSLPSKHNRWHHTHFTNHKSQSSFCFRALSNISFLIQLRLKSFTAPTFALKNLFSGLHFFLKEHFFTTEPQKSWLYGPGIKSYKFFALRIKL